MRFTGNQARPRQLDKQIQILRWILRFGYIDKTTTMHLLSLAASAAADTLKDMVELGLIARLLGHGTSCWLYRLTPAGGRAVNPYREEYDEGLKALTNPTELGVHYSCHNLVAQRYAAEWIAKKNYRGHVLSPRQIRAHGLEIGVRSENKGAWKVPDMLLIEPVPAHLQEVYDCTDFRTAVEVQQSSEAESTRAYKLWQYWTALQSVQITSFVYCSTYDFLRRAYEQQWRGGLEERVYDVERHKWGRPTNPRVIAADNELLDHGQFLLLPHDPYATALYPSPSSLRSDEAEDEETDA